MKKLKGLKIVLAVVLFVFVLVIVKTTGKNHFKNDAENVLEAVKSNNFRISLKELKENENQFLIVDLGVTSSNEFKNSLKIPFEKLLDETTLQQLKETQNKIVFVSNDNSVAVKAWVILNQLDFRNTFILSGEEDGEILKYEFQPDTMARLESDSY